MGGTVSIPRDKTQKLQVIGAGFSRTGTSTLQLALTRLLDGPVLHGGTQVLHANDKFNKQWVDAFGSRAHGDAEQTRKLLSSLMAGYVGCSDVPSIYFLSELLDLYPEARVVLTTRDADRWLASMDHVRRRAGLWWLPYVIWPVPGWRWLPILRSCYHDASGWKGGYTRDFLSRYNEHVKAMVPPDKLLVYDVKDGWGPLCEFLGLPVPDEPLPRANDVAEIDRTIRTVIVKVLLVWLGIFSAGCLLILAFIRAWASK